MNILAESSQQKANEELSQKCFGKSRSSVTSQELHKLTEAVLKNLYINRKNLNLSFLNTINFILNHKKTHIIDYNVDSTEFD